MHMTKQTTLNVEQEAFLRYMEAGRKAHALSLISHAAHDKAAKASKELGNAPFEPASFKEYIDSTHAALAASKEYTAAADEVIRIGNEWNASKHY